MLTVGCTKDGKTGPQGPAGTNGTNGANGNANVQNISITVSPSQWTYDAVNDRMYYRYSYPIDTVKFNSAVCAYIMSTSGEQAIPYYSCPSSNVWCEQYDMALDLFQFPAYIEFQYTNYKSKTTAPTGDDFFYLVVIPPSQRKAHPDVNYKNYQEVKKAFNLKD